jgi:hypothetical protein
MFTKTSTLSLKVPDTDMNGAQRGFWDVVRTKVSKGRYGVTTISVKIAIMAGLAMALSFGAAFAGISGAPAPSNPEDEPLSSQSSAALNESECLAVWSEATAGEDRLSYDKAAPYVRDLQAADPDNDGYFDKTEFVDACQKGLVQSASKDATVPKSSHIMLPRGLREQN